MGPNKESALFSKSSFYAPILLGLILSQFTLMVMKRGKESTFRKRDEQEYLRPWWLIPRKAGCFYFQVHLEGQVEVDPWKVDIAGYCKKS
jgi:hypothetical protein